MNLRACNILLVSALLLASACKFPEPTRPENYNRGSSSSSARETSGKPEDLQSQVQTLKADHQSTLDDVDQKIRTLQDKIDMLEHSVMEEQKKSERINQDIDRRLTEMEKRTFSAAPAVTTPAAVTAPATVETPKAAETSGNIVPEKSIANSTEQQYQSILDAFLEEKNYDRSIKDFKKFIQAHPKDQLAGNAQYWIGEAYYSKADYPKAITEFQKVIDNYPSSTKKCDTLLKQGMAFTNMKDPSNAKLFLKETVDQCSGTTASEKAKKLL